jgi:hypothetical protein
MWGIVPLAIFFIYEYFYRLEECYELAILMCFSYLIVFPTITGTVYAFLEMVMYYRKKSARVNRATAQYKAEK